MGILASVRAEPTHARRFDWRGIALLAVGIGALQLCLDRGQGLDWFGSWEIQLEAALAFLRLSGYMLHWSESEHTFLTWACCATPISPSGAD